MQNEMAIFDSLVEIRRFAKNSGKADLLREVEKVEGIASAELCASYGEKGNDDFYRVMMQIFPDNYRNHA
jgi:hypothetical protein